MKNYRKSAFVVLLFICTVSNITYAQISIRGVISDQQNGSPLELSNILLQDLSNKEDLRGTTTDGNGLYEFSNVERGTYLFRVSYVGYQTYTDTIQVEFRRGREEDINKSIRMAPNEDSQGSVDVVYQRRNQDLEAGQLQIRKIDLQRVSTPGGGGDLAAYLQTLPGVVASGDRGGQFFVRGGTPSQNLSMIDGITIFRPFHIIGFFSVFPEEMVSNVDFYAGGFGPKYTGRTSSVLDVRLRNGDFEENRFSASVSPFLAEGFFEGPLDKGNSSFMILTRGSLLEEASQYYPTGEQPLRFNSQAAKFSMRNDQGTNCSALTLRTFDRGKLDYKSKESFTWNNFLIGGRCALIPKNSSFSFFDVNMGYSRSKNLVGLQNDPERSSTISKFNIDVNYTRFVGKVEIEYGSLINMRWLNLDISDLYQFIYPSKESFVTMGAYGNVKVPIGEKLFVEPGLATSVFWSHFKPILEPRIQASWLPRNNTNERINAAIGMYSQPMAGIMDLRDAGSAFTAWMPVPDSDKMMESIHAILGWRQPFGTYIDFSLEAYRKWLKDIPVSTWSVLPKFDTHLSYADGTVLGTDISVEYNIDVFYAKIGYGYSITEYKSTQQIFETWFGSATQTYHPGHDRRHQANLQTGLNFGDFSFNIGWNYGSGLPYSRPFGFDGFVQFGPHLPDVTNDYGTPRILLKRPFNGRLPDYHSLNISAEQTFNLKAMRVAIRLGSVNTYDQQNLFYYDVQNQREIYQLPFYPYLSLKVETK